MRGQRHLYGHLGLDKDATPDDVKRVLDKKKSGVFVGDGYKGHFAKEAKAVLSDVVLRHHYAATGAGFSLDDQRLADSDDAWLQELLDDKNAKAKKAAGNGSKSAASGGGGGGGGLLGGAIGWLGLGKSASISNAKEAKAPSSAKPETKALEEKISALLTRIGDIFETAGKAGGMGPEAIGDTNDLLKELVSVCSEDTSVALRVVGGKGVTGHIAQLINNPAGDLEMKVWSSAVITLMSLSDRDRSAITSRPSADVPGVLDMYAEYVANHATHFNALALEGGEVDLSAVEYERSILGNVFLTLARVSEQEEGCAGLARTDMVRHLILFVSCNAPMMSATQVLNLCAVLRHLVDHSDAMRAQFAEDAPVMVSLLCALCQRASPRLPQAAEAAGHLAAAVAAAASAEHPPLSDVFVRTLQAAAASPLLTEVPPLLYKALARSAPAAGSEAPAVAGRAGLKDKQWETLVSHVAAALEQPEAAECMAAWVDARVLTGAEAAGKRSTLALVADELFRSEAEAKPKVAAVITHMLSASDPAFLEAFGPIAQTVVDKLAQSLANPVVGREVLRAVRCCVEKAVALQPSLLSHLLQLVRQGGSQGEVARECCEVLALLSKRLQSTDKIGTESQKYLVQLLGRADTGDAVGPICEMLTNLHAQGNQLQTVVEAAPSFKDSTHECVRALSQRLSTSEEAARESPLPDKQEETKAQKSKKASKGEKSPADLEKKETKARKTIESEEAQTRNPYQQKYDAEGKKLRQRLVAREERERAEELRRAREEEERAAAKLRKKTSALEGAEEQKRQEIAARERDEGKKLHHEVEKTTRGIVKEVKEAAAREAALRKAKEDAARRAEEQRAHEDARQDQIRRHNERLEEGRKATTAAAAAAAAAATGGDSPSPQTPADEGDELEAMLAAASAATKARVAGAGAGLGGRKDSGSGRPGQYVPPSERRRAQEEEAEKRRHEEERQKAEDAARRRAEQRRAAEEEERRQREREEAEAAAAAAAAAAEAAAEEERRLEEERQREREEAEKKQQAAAAAQQQQQQQAQAQQQQQQQLLQQQAMMFPQVFGMHPGLPGVPGVGGLALPGVQVPGVPGVAGVPGVPGMPGMPGMPPHLAGLAPGMRPGMPLNPLMQMQFMQLQAAQMAHQQAVAGGMTPPKAAAAASLHEPPVSQPSPPQEPMPTAEEAAQANMTDEEAVGCWKSILAKQLELVALRKDLLPHGVTNEKEREDEQTLMQVWAKHDKSRISLETHIHPAKMQILRNFYREKIPEAEERKMQKPQPIQPKPQQQAVAAAAAAAAAAGFPMPGQFGGAPMQPPPQQQQPPPPVAQQRRHAPDGGAEKESVKVAREAPDAGDGFDDEVDGTIGEKPAQEYGRQASSDRRGDAQRQQQQQQQQQPAQKLPAKSSVRLAVSGPAPAQQQQQGGKGGAAAGGPPPGGKGGGGDRGGGHEQGGKRGEGAGGGAAQQQQQPQQQGGKQGGGKGEFGRRDNGAVEAGAGADGNKQDRQGNRGGRQQQQQQQQQQQKQSQQKEQAAPPTAVQPKIDLAAEFPSLGSAASLKKEKEDAQQKVQQEKARARAAEQEREAAERKEKDQLEELKRTQNGQLQPPQQARLNTLLLHEERAAYKVLCEKELIKQGMYAGSLRVQNKVMPPKTPQLQALEKLEEERLAKERAARQEADRRLQEKKREEEAERRKKREREREKQRERDQKASVTPAAAVPADEYDRSGGAAGASAGAPGAAAAAVAGGAAGRGRGGRRTSGNTGGSAGRGGGGSGAATGAGGGGGGGGGAQDWDGQTGPPPTAQPAAGGGKRNKGGGGRGGGGTPSDEGGEQGGASLRGGRRGGFSRR